MSLKNQVRILVTVFVLLLLENGCKQRIVAHGKFINVYNGSQPYNAMMYLNRDHGSWGMIVRENTLNDTALIGIMKVPPGRLGKLFQVECFSDSIPFNYRPYKATKGKLVIEYFSSVY